MTMIMNKMLLAFLGFSSGIIISGGVFAFIASIGVVSRFAVKTNTQKYANLYEDAITLGGLFAAASLYIEYYLPFGIVVAIIVSLLIGIFFGCVAVSLAEVLDVIPIFLRHTKIKYGVNWFMLAIALGKMAGSLLYCFYFTMNK